MDIGSVREYGLIEEYQRLGTPRCRPFNKITTVDGYIVKEGLTEQGKELAKDECAWYKSAKQLGCTCIPKVYSVNPLKLEHINGKNIYEYTDLSTEQKRCILKRLVDCLKALHKCAEAPFDKDSYYEAYIAKTFNRLEKIKALVPFAEDEYITVNGKKCHNVFFCRERLEELFDEIQPRRFAFIHGDCTFSNMMLRDDNEPVLIDPRGYFGKTKLYGDPAYDWAKLYYSLVGNYDRFNLKQFELKINDSDVELSIASSGWEELESYFFSLTAGEVSEREIRLIHSVIWLSLTTYAWENYDSICGAFYNGLLHLGEVL
jgi:thiamine kinase-like enzyme